MSFSVWYSSDCEGDAPESRLHVEVPVDPSKDASWAASEAAEHYWGHHDGWEASWPRIVSLFAAENAEEPFAQYVVSMEAVPRFYAESYTPKARVTR
jgi:hypothetical protein